MTVDRKLLEILVCPVTKVPVRPLPKDKLAILNRELEKGEVVMVGGGPANAALEEALITEDGRTVYRVESDIPVMLEDEGIATHQIPGW